MYLNEHIGQRLGARLNRGWQRQLASPDKYYRRRLR